MSESMNTYTLRAVITRLAYGFSYSAFQTVTGVSKGFISKVSNAIKEAGMTPEQLMDCSSDEIRKVIYPPQANTRPQPDWKAVKAKLKKTRITRQAAYEEYCTGLPENAQRYSYSSFCRKLNESE